MSFDRLPDDKHDDLFDIVDVHTIFEQEGIQSEARLHSSSPYDYRDHLALGARVYYNSLLAIMIP